MLPHAVHCLAFADSSSVQSLPWIAHAMIGVCLVIGAVLWLAGRKVIKPVFSLLGAALGGAIGFLMLPEAISSVAGIPSPYIGLGAGAIIGLMGGIALLRFAMAIGTGVAFGVAGLLICATYLHMTVGLSTPKPVGVPSAAALISNEPTPLTRERFISEGVAPVAQRVQGFVRENSESFKNTWESQKEQDKVVLGVSALGAALFGFFLALFAPSRSTSLATAMLGSAIVLGCSIWLLNAFEAPGRRYLEQGPIVWLGVWAAAAVLGVAVQMKSGKRQQHSSAPQ
jgi:hypothetical protein